MLQGLPGVQAFHSGGDIEFYRPIYYKDYITPKCIFTGFDVKSSEFAGKAGKMILEYQRAEYYNQRNELVAKSNLWVVRTGRRSATEAGKYSKIEHPHPWTDEEIARIEDEVMAEKPRGASSLYWEDVMVGEELPPLVKGPMGFSDMMCYFVGALPVPIYAHSVKLRLFREHPLWAFYRDPDSNAMESVVSVHFNKGAAKSVGAGYPYDGGVMRHCYLIQLLTNWMGDEGWLKRSYAEYRRFFYQGDAIWLTGKVTRKYIDEEGNHCVYVETHGMNQRGEDTMPGFSIVALPSREVGDWPVGGRLPPNEFRGTGES